MNRLIGTLFLVSVATVIAHPGVGIVRDQGGSVFFTDTSHVWRISPDGRVSLAVSGVHTHELCLDANDNLYGEHLWYEGDATRRWAHRVWCRAPDGSLRDVVPAREGFLAGYSFVRDRAGNMYWAERQGATVIRKRAPDGTTATHAAAGFRAVGRMTALPDGTLFLMDAGDLRRVYPDGRTATVVTRLSARPDPPESVRDPHYHMGVWTDQEARVYVAIAAERVVLRVNADGAVDRVVARSPEPWAPSGGTVDPAGNLWVLEYDADNAVRVRRLGPDGGERVFRAETSQR